MNIPTILAHGALGELDEMIFFSVGAIFVIVMGLAWFRSRMTDVRFSDDPPEAHDQAEHDADTPTEHFRLE